MFEEIKANGIPRGKVFIVDGEQGAGKTSFVVSLFRLDYKYQNRKMLEIAQSFIDEQNAIYARENRTLPKDKRIKYLELPPHLYFSSINIALYGRLNPNYDPENESDRRRHTHWINVQRLGLPNSEYEVQYFPYGSVVFIAEADLQLHSHDWQQISKYLRVLLKYVRKNALTVIFDLQVNSELGKQLRELATDLITIENNLYTKPKFFGLIKAKTTFYGYHSKPQSINAARDVGDDKRSLDYTHKVRLRVRDNPWQAFDTIGERVYFLRGLEKVGYQTIGHPKRSCTPSDIEKYCEMNPLVPPKETDKKQSERDETAA
ncbi:MAG: hypothetical protein K2L88_04315 [Clostridiales bacterium]|nr:hypothetical protein [Clostridiales bacterium]